MIKAWDEEKWVPDTCCYPAARFSSDGVHCGRSNDPEQWFPNGCMGQLELYFLRRLHVVGIIGLVVAFLQVTKHFFAEELFLDVVQFFQCISRRKK